MRFRARGLFLFRDGRESIQCFVLGYELWERAGVGAQLELIPALNLKYRRDT